MAGHTGPQSRRSLQLKVVLAVCGILAAAWLLQAVVDWRSAVLPLLGLQPLHGRTHHAQNSVTIPAGLTVGPTTQRAANSIKDAARTAAAAVKAAPASTRIVYKQPLVLGQKDGKPAAAIMLLHGLGESQEGISGLAEALLAQPGMGNVRIIIPEAPKRTSTVSGGAVMNAWYDIKTFHPINEDEDEEALKESARYVASLIWDYNLMGASPNRVAVIGYSQGGAIASLLLRRSELRYGAVVVLSSYMPLRHQPPVVSKLNMATPILMCHGDADNVVEYQFGTQTYELLKQVGANVILKTYEGMRHSIRPEVIRDVAGFVQQSVLKP